MTWHGDSSVTVTTYRASSRGEDVLIVISMWLYIVVALVLVRGFADAGPASLQASLLPTSCADQ